MNSIIVYRIECDICKRGPYNCECYAQQGEIECEARYWVSEFTPIWQFSKFRHSHLNLVCGSINKPPSYVMEDITSRVFNLVKLELTLDALLEVDHTGQVLINKLESFKILESIPLGN